MSAPEIAVHDWGDSPELYGPRHDFREALILRRLLPALPGPEVLNAGAGAGSLTLKLVDRGLRVTSTDYSPELCEWTRRALRARGAEEGNPVVAGDLQTLELPPASFDDYHRWLERQVELINHGLEGIPEDRVRYHVCWGSWPGPHTSDVPLKDIVDLILKVKVGAYVIEGANPRHEHEWKVWKDAKLAPGQMLIPGVISHATNVVEHPELVSERIVRLAEIVGRENVIAGTDCGFAQGPFHRRVHPSIMWAKLEALVAGARLASKALWQ